MAITPGKYRITTALDRERSIGVDPRTNDAHKRVIVVPKEFPPQAGLWRVDRTETEGVYLLSVLGADAVDTDAKVFANYGVDSQRWRIGTNSHPDGYFIQRVDNNLTWFLPKTKDFTQDKCHGRSTPHTGVITATAKKLHSFTPLVVPFASSHRETSVRNVQM